MRIAFFGSSLVSAYWNGAATYYRGLLRALARGHAVTFYELDAFERQAHRDIPDPPWARVLALRRPGNRVALWGVDAPAALERVERDRGDPFRPLVPRYDLVFTTYAHRAVEVEAASQGGAASREIA